MKCRILTWIILIAVASLVLAAPAMAQWVPWTGGTQGNWTSTSTPLDEPDPLVLELAMYPQNSWLPLSHAIYQTDPETMSRLRLTAARGTADAIAPDSFGFGFGFEMLFAPGLQMFALPISQDVFHWLEIGASIPAARKEMKYKGEKGTVYGIGDIPFYFRMPLETGRFKELTEIMLKAPTGNPRAADGALVIPTGTGSWDISLAGTLSIDLDEHNIEAALSYRDNGWGEFGPYRYCRSSVTTYLAGYMYGFFGGLMWGGASINGISKGRSRIEVEDEIQSVRDRLFIMDLSPSVEFLNFYAEFAIPLVTETDPDAEEPDTGRWALQVGYSSGF